MIALRTTFATDAAKGLDASYELRLAEDTFHAHVADGHLTLTRRVADHPDATIETDPTTLRSLVFGDRDLPEALDSAS